MDHNRLLLRVVVQDDHLEQSAGTVRTDDKVPPFTGDHSKGMANGMVNVLVADAVPAGAIRDLHLDKGALSIITRQGAPVTTTEEVR